MTVTRAAPVKVTIINDYPMVVAGLRALLAPYAGRISVRRIDGLDDLGKAEVVLVDTFGGVDVGPRLEDIVVATSAQVLVFSWAATPERQAAYVSRGAAGYLSKRATAEEMVTAIEAVASGRHPVAAAASTCDGLGSWPGQHDGLTEREAEIVALVTAGLTNIEIARRLFLSVNTVKTYVRTAYRKMPVVTRTQAVLWGLDHGFRPRTGDRVVVLREVWLYRACRHCADPGPHPPAHGQLGTFVCSQCYARFAEID